MNLPFLFENQKDKWEPRHRPGRDGALTTVEKEILDCLDVQEQQQTYYAAIAVRAYNIGMFTLLMCLITNGPTWVRVIQKWIAGGG